MDLFDIAFARKNSNGSSGSDLYATTDYVDSKLSEKLDADASAVSADKLTTARNISLSGDVTSQAISFDGSRDLVIVTKIDCATEDEILTLFD